MKGKFCLLAGITAGLILSGCGNENKEMAQITQITAQCIPGVYGRMVERFVLKTEDIVPLLSLTVQDFTIQNAFINSTEFNDELKVR